ncbi:MAG: hypothetical protein C0407_06275 [Desulfobacca sp.]|nr:hypothetical protein [Desulfobacca sp.]
MGIAKEVEEILKAKSVEERLDISRLQRLISEKRAKGIIPPQKTGLPNLQDTERHSRNILFKNTNTLTT